MDKYTPDELRDLPNMKHRVMQKVLENVTSKQKKRSFNIRFTVLTAAFTLGICLFVGYEVINNKEAKSPEVVLHDPNEMPSEERIGNYNFMKDELAVDYWKRSPASNTENNEENIDPNPAPNANNDGKDTEPIANPKNDDKEEDSSETTSRDFTRPNITVSNNKFYIEGVSLGDSVQKVTSILGTNYTSTKEVDHIDGGDLQLIYNNIAYFYFYENKLFEVIIMETNSTYYDKYFNASPLIKIEDEEVNYLLLKEAEQLIKTQMSNNKRILYLMYAKPEFYYHYPEYKN